MCASIAVAAGYWSIDPQALFSSRLPKMKRTALNRLKRQAVILSAKANAFGLNRRSVHCCAMVQRIRSEQPFKGRQQALSLMAMKTAKAKSAPPRVQSQNTAKRIDEALSTHPNCIGHTDMWQDLAVFIESVDER